MTFTLGSTHTVQPKDLTVQVKCVIPRLKEKSITEMAVKLVRHIHRNPLRATRMADHRILSMVKKSRLTASSWMQNMWAKLPIKPTVKGKYR